MRKLASYVDQIKAALRQDPTLVDIEVYDGTTWISLNDGHRYRLAADSLSDSTQGISRVGVRSSMYDGEWITHTTRDNVTESISVYALGSNHSEVSEHVEDLTEAFSQYLYNVRLSLGNHVEIWRCFPADWSVQRGHVDIHNTRATVRLQVPRMPRIAREVRQ